VSTYQYAAYGSNLHWLRLQRRVPSAKYVGPGFLEKRTLRFNKRSNIDGSGKGNIVDGGSGVHLAIFEIALSEKTILDRCEGLGYGYDEISVNAAGFGECLTYIADPDSVDDELIPMDWYKEMVILGCKANKFPLEYLRKLEAVDARNDPDTERSREQWDIVQALRGST
jgi:gamma-glutamylcyclotransferase